MKEGGLMIGFPLEAIGKTIVMAGKGGKSGDKWVSLF
jgi:hypothetical protein